MAPFAGDVLGTTIVECTFDEALALERVELVPGALLDGRRAHEGLPGRVTGERAAEMLAHIDELSTRFDTDVVVAEDRGLVQPA